MSVCVWLMPVSGEPRLPYPRPSPAEQESAPLWRGIVSRLVRVCFGKLGEGLADSEEAEVTWLVPVPESLVSHNNKNKIIIMNKITLLRFPKRIFCFMLPDGHSGVKWVCGGGMVYRSVPLLWPCSV